VTTDSSRGGSANCPNCEHSQKGCRKKSYRRSRKDQRARCARPGLRAGKAAGRDIDQFHSHRSEALLWARTRFLLELNGKDLRDEPFEVRKATLASLLRCCQPGLRLNEHLAQPGDLVFRHACKMGLEGIVSKRLGSRYRSGRTKDWLKFKNPNGRP
jgi:ATP dependent DNA ligase domain